MSFRQRPGAATAAAVATRSHTAVENMSWVGRDVVDVLNGRRPSDPAP
jgi:hypothetical protein